MQDLSPTGFRKNCGKINEWYDARKPIHSNFNFIDRFFDSEHTVRRIFSLARKLDLCSFLVESIDSHNERIQEDDNLLRQCNCDFTNSQVWRVSFFASEKDHRPALDDFLGYAVIRKEFFKNRRHNLFIYESILKPYRHELHNNFIHCKRTYKVAYPFGIFDITGVLYAQQNGLSFVCAHVALRSVLSLLLPEGDISYAEINQLAEITQYPVPGLRTHEITQILAKKNIISKEESPASLEKTKKVSFYSSLYGNIESGCPSLLAFNTTNSSHVVPVIGHTFNEDTWVSDARKFYFGLNEYYSSEGWLSTYIIHDDNFGPYLCIPRNFIEKGNFLHLWGLNQCKDALCFEKTELVALEILNSFIDLNPMLYISWYDRLVHFVKNKQIVLRSIFIRREQYIQFLQNYWLEEYILDRFKKLPEFFWMVEISCPELFSATRAKFGEILLSCNEVDINFAGTAKPLAFRLPGVVYFEGDTLPKRTCIETYTHLHSDTT